jgi:hypothetical protein
VYEQEDGTLAEPALFYNNSEMYLQVSYKKFGAQFCYISARAIEISTSDICKPAAAE